MAKVKQIEGPIAKEITSRENRERYNGLMEIEKAYNDEQLRRTREMRNIFYAGIDPYRSKEIAMGGMVREDHNSMANLPTQAIHTEYPGRFGTYTSPFIDDTVLG